MYDQITLPNGLRIIGESIGHLRSVSVGVWVGAGSQYESPAQSGLSHLVEHMVFKGTKKRTPRDIAEEMDAIGAQMNAATAKECTCYYVKSLSEHLPLAVDMLSDLVLNATLPSDELNKERGVIVEEINMVEDTPEDIVHELLSEACFYGHPLAQPILGPIANIERFTCGDIRNYLDAFYRPKNVVLSVAGRYDWDAFVLLAVEYFGSWSPGASAPTHGAQPTFTPRKLSRTKDIGQAHICLGFPGVGQKDDALYALSAFNNVFGGSMSSRLFQKIREERGLAYSVYSYPTAYQDCGLFTIYVGTGEKFADTAVELIDEEIALILKDGITQKEFSQAIEQLKSGFILGQESASSRMTALGRRLLLNEETRTEEDVLRSINAVTRDQVAEIAHRVLTSPRAMSMVGK